MSIVVCPTFVIDKSVPVERIWVLYLALKGLLGNVKVLCRFQDLNYF